MQNVQLSPRRFAIAAVFSVIVFTSKAFAPAPFKDSFVIVQALLLGLAGLLIAPFGATLVSTIAGLLLAGWSPGLGIFSVSFSILYGLMLDVSLLVLHPLRETGRLDARRFTFAVTLSTVAIGAIAYSVTLALRLLPRNLGVEVVVLVFGGITGTIGGYLGVLIWRRIGTYLQR
ncbi:hypothetical protein A3K71_04320 [archaeon RBG_16_50_20]|nr:MAG: hypothetical protein A3K71_04320 [archaeon RBG_16_50_20]